MRFNVWVNNSYCGAISNLFVNNLFNKIGFYNMHILGCLVVKSLISSGLILVNKSDRYIA